MHSLDGQFPLPLWFGLLLIMGANVCPSEAAVGSEKGHLVISSSLGSQSTPASAIFFQPGSTLSELPVNDDDEAPKMSEPIPVDSNGSAVDRRLSDNHQHSHTHVEKRDLNERIRQTILEQQRAGNYTGCDTCRKMHLDSKQASLDHIKSYVLSYLGFNDSEPPKKPNAFTIPDAIWDNYYAAQSTSGKRKTNPEWEEERRNHQYQQRYLERPRSGLVSDPDYLSDDPNWNISEQLQEEPQPQTDKEQETFRPVVKTNRIYVFANGELTWGEVARVE